MEHKKVLIHLIGNIGDVIVATSAVALLKNIHPEYEITMLVRSLAAELVENNPVIDHVMYMDYNSQSKSWSYMLHLLKWLKSSHFDMSISFDRKARLAWLTFLAGIPVRIGPDRILQYNLSKITRLYTYVVHEPTDWYITSQAALFQHIIQDYFTTTDSAAPCLADISAAQYEKVQTIWSEINNSGKGKIVGVCLQGNLARNNWPIDKFAQCLQRVAEHEPVKFYIAGTAAEYEYAQTLVQGVSVPIVNLCGRTSLLELREIIKKSDAFLSVDTGTAHLAATTDTPLIVLYRCSVQHRWRAMTNKLVPVVSARRADKGCPSTMENQDMCPDNVFACVYEISSSEVAKAVLSVF